MIKIYTVKDAAADNYPKTPKENVVAAILNFSKSLEVVKLKNEGAVGQVEIMLN